METVTRINSEQLLRALSPARMEMGLREAMYVAEDAIRFKCGFGHSTCYVTVSLNAHDLYEFVILKARGTKTTVFAESSPPGVFADRLAESLVAAWCGVCSKKGW